MPRVVPLLLRGPGEAHFGPIPINPNAEVTTITVDVSLMTDEDQAWEVEVETSIDGGETWQFAGAVHRQGGVKTVAGVPLTVAGPAPLHWLVMGTGKRIRGVLTVGEVVIVNGRPKCNPSTGRSVVLALDVD